VSPALVAQGAAAAAAVCVVASVRAFAAGHVGRLHPPVRRGLAATARGARLADTLSRAGIAWAPELVVATALGATAVGAIGVWALFGSVVGPVVVVAAAAGAARAFLGSVERRYVTRIAAQLPAIAQQLASGVAAGLSLRQAITRTAADAPEPAAAELRSVAADLALGARVDEALDRMVSRLPNPDLAVMVTAILVQRRTGGNMARALGELAVRLEERTALARELRGATAQARATAWMVAALPVLGGIAFELAAPGAIGRTLGHGIGVVVLGVSVALEVAGFVLVRRLARVEP